MDYFYAKIPKIAISEDLDCEALGLAVGHSSKTVMRVITFGIPR